MANVTFHSTAFALRILERLVKSRFRLDGTEHIDNDRPILYVINHFTRAETFLVPYLIYKQTGHYVHSLADDSLFKGRLADYFHQMGVISTKQKGRDRLIIGDLLTGRRNWVMYPEGMMVKSKKLIRKGKIAIASPTRILPPHRGAAVLALKSEIYRLEYLDAVEKNDLDAIDELHSRYNISDPAEVLEHSTIIVPVTITYYPLRPGQNLVKRLVKKFFKELPERLEEELEIEGNILLHNTDIDLYFGEPIRVRDYIGGAFTLTRRFLPFFRSVEKPNILLRAQSEKLTRRFMRNLYSKVQINFDHLFCAALHQLKCAQITTENLARALYLTGTELKKDSTYRLHPTLGDGLIRTISALPYEPMASISDLAENVRVVDRIDNAVIVNRLRLNMMHMFHNVRLKNPIIVLANELEPLKDVVRLIRRNVNLKESDIKQRLSDAVFEDDKRLFQADYEQFYQGALSKPADVGAPFFLRSDSSNIGVVLAHGYLAAPSEMREAAEFLHERGYSVYGVRLRGHGTAPENLAHVPWEEWVNAYLRGYAALSNCCAKVIVGGFSTGGLLALLTAAGNHPNIAGAFAINSPIKLQHICAGMAPAVNFWNELLDKFNIDGARLEYVDNVPENGHINYSKIYLKGIVELDKLFHHCQRRLRDVRIATAIIQSESDPTVNPRSAEKIYSLIRSPGKSLEYLDFDRHVIVQGPECRKVFEKIHYFIRRATYPHPAFTPSRSVPVPAFDASPVKTS